MKAASAEANLVLLEAQPDVVRFPALCPNCCQTAAATLRVERSFLFYVHSDDEHGPNRNHAEMLSFDVPFCNACIEQQRTQRATPDPWLPLRRVLSEAQGFGGLVALVIAGFFLKEALLHLKIVPLFLGALPLFFGYRLVRETWRNSAHMSLPTPTPTDLSIDFTPYLSLAFEPPWLAFQFQSPQYAAEFLAVNAAHPWNPQGPVAKSAAASRRRENARINWVVVAVVAVVAVWALWQEFFAP